MKKTTILLTLLCASALNGMEPEPNQYMSSEILPLDIKERIILDLSTYDNLNDVIYAIKAMGMTNKTFMKIINEKYGDPEKLETFALALYDRFITKPRKLLNHYRKTHAQDYKAICIWHENAHLHSDDQLGRDNCLVGEEKWYLDRDDFLVGKEKWYVDASLNKKELECMYSNYQKGLTIRSSEPHVPTYSIDSAIDIIRDATHIIRKFKTPAAKEYAQNLAANLAEQKLISASKELLGSHNFDNTKQLINNGANVNYFDDEGVTPLLRALQKGSPSNMIQLLLASGANPHARDNYNQGVFKYLDICYPQTFEFYRIQKQKIQKLLEEALEKHASLL